MAPKADLTSSVVSKRLTEEAQNVPASLSRECFGAHILLGELGSKTWKELPMQTTVMFHISQKSNF